MRAEVAERHLREQANAGAAVALALFGCSTIRFSSTEPCGLRQPCRITKPADG